MKKKEKKEGRFWNLGVIRFLTSQREAPAEGDLLSKWSAGLRRGAEAAIRLLHLEHVVEGSVFLHPWLFCLAILFLTPFLPTMIMLALLGAGVLSLILTYGKGLGRVRLYGPPLRWAALLAVIYALSVFTSVNVGESLYPGMLTAVFMLAGFTAFLGIARWGDLRRAFTVVALGAVAVSLYGFWQRLHPEAYESGWLDEDMFASVAFRVYSTLQNPNVLGEYFLLVTPFAFALALTAGNRRKKILWLAATAAMCICLLLTYSRGCYLGLAFSAAVFLVLLDRRFLILIGAGLLLCPFVLPDTIWSRILSIGDMGDTSTQYRVQIWQGSLRMLRDYWLCGVGPGEGAFNSVYPLYTLNAVDTPHSHSLYLQILCETGIAGLAAFLGFLGSLYRSLLTALRHCRRWETKIFAMAGISAFSGFLLQSLTDHAFYNYRVTLLFFLLAGLCTLLRHEEILFAPYGTAGALALKQHEMPMVLHILSDSNLGGAGRYLLNLFAAYDRERYEMVLALPKGGALAAPAREKGVPVVEVDMDGETSLDLKNILTLRQLCMLLRPDIVQTHGSLSGRIAARAVAARIVYTRHSVFPVKPQKGLRVWGNRHYTDIALAVSPAAEENLKVLGIPAGRIVTMMNGAEPLVPASPQEQSALRQQYGVTEGIFTAGIFARLEPYKGQETILEAAALLKRQGKSLNLLICGTGSQEEALKAHIEKLGLGDMVIMTGFVEKVDGLMSLLDVQINASTGTETSSLSLIEGMSLGIPVIASRYGGTPYLIHQEEEGLLFPPGDSEALAACLTRMMEEPEFRKACGNRAKNAYLEKYTAKIFAENVENVYADVLRRRAPS